MNDFFELSHDGAIAHLKLNRPERIEHDGTGLLSCARDAVRALDDAGTTRALVVSSTGKHFSAGMSLDVFAGDGPQLARRRRASASFQESLRRLIDCFSALDEARFPVVCAIQGGCIGGALDLATACDIRICSADAFFTVQETRSAWPPTSACCSACRSSCRKAWRARWPTPAND